MNNLSPVLAAALLQESCRRSLYHAHLLFFEILNGFTLKPAPYIEAICFRYERLLRGETSRLINTMPPRMGKSELTASLVAFALGHDPTLKFMLVSYGLELSAANLDKVRTIMRDRRYQAIFPNAKIKPGKNRRHHFETTAGGEVRAISTGGVVTGFGTHFLIIDDLLKADEALTAAGREAAIRFYKNSLLSRFNDPASARIVLVGQRLHENDIVGHVKGLGVRWDHINLPAIAEQDEIIPLGRGRIWTRRKGDLLHPEHMPRWVLDEKLLEFGPRYFAAQYQQNPTVSESCLINLDWFGQYEKVRNRTYYHKVVQSVDPAITDGANSDYSVGMTWGYREGNWYLLDLFRVKVNFPALRELVIAWHRQWRADALIIEGVSIGHALWAEMKRAELPGLILCPTPKGSKFERLAGCTARLASGKYHLPVSAPWLADLRHELMAFPEGRHDDQVDALTQFLEFVFDRPSWVRATYGPDGRRNDPIIRKSRIQRGY
ncbi:phage terminase large subunit [Rhizorhabdus wittichii]|uniref:Phage terminase large subunit n=1 Tax=Rhizorhabdus wittichii TaxID=160791 RepID=A0A975CZE2_9SPHN|nr:phage terminase large subunit [Rhizorhabdus wittichii]QTH20103.1 phage terminase large subunit [Rhizorhabdus wittichii]